MECEALDIPEVKLLKPRVFKDDRGFFSETYNKASYGKVGIDVDFCQDNFSYSVHSGTVRGLHYQAPPFAQSKLVRVLRGSIIDVAVDARRSSSTFGHWVSAELSSENMRQLFVPRGFLHGFITLTPNTEVAYKVDAFYDNEADGAVVWNDPDLAIDWGAHASEPVLSDKDKNAPSWAQFESPF
ncbi:MAG: dTDP-4-dehydrorhamnose 3,5-epimerase [Pseudomonadota bacterium]